MQTLNNNYVDLPVTFMSMYWYLPVHYWQLRILKWQLDQNFRNIVQRIVTIIGMYPEQPVRSVDFVMAILALNRANLSISNLHWCEEQGDRCDRGMKAFPSFAVDEKSLLYQVPKVPDHVSENRNIGVDYKKKKYCCSRLVSKAFGIMGKFSCLVSSLPWRNRDSFFGVFSTKWKHHFGYNWER
jgi:hypothetical protein